MSSETSAKKVRSACRRCRLRRVKCDGQVPACGNCAKAGVPCMDVDGRNAEQLIPRTFLVNGPARIRWLENVIRTNIPDFDLAAGPQVDLSSLESPPGLPTAQNEASPSFPFSVEGDDDHPPQQQFVSSPQNPQVPKRPHTTMASSGSERPLAEEARSVVTDLGMLTLNSDSRQRHYLGSSSGLLFTRIIGAGPEDFSSPQQGDGRSVPRDNHTIEPTRSERSRAFAQHRQAKRLHQQLYTQLQNDLPTKEETYSLLETYFREVHPDHPCLHAPSFLDAVQALYDSADLGPDTSVGHNGWPESIKPFPYNGNFEKLAGAEVTPISIYAAAFQVFMVLNLAATVRTRGKNFEVSPTRFYRAAMSYAAECFSSITLPSLQGLILLAVRSLMIPAEINIWTLVHICIAHSIDLGIHREHEDLRNESRNIRRFIFYTAYSLERRSIATIQGRPLGIRDEAFDVQLPSMTGQTSNQVWESDLFGIKEVAAQLDSYSIHNFKLHRILSNIKLLLYHLPTGTNTFLWPNDTFKCQHDLQKELNDWFQQIPGTISQLRMSGDLEPAEIELFRLKLKLRYHAAMILLYQPSQAIRNPNMRSLKTCFDHAIERIRGYDALHARDSLYLSWRTVQSIFASGTVMVYCFWASNVMQQSVSFISLPKELRTCSNLLSASGEWWPSVKRGKESFERIVDLTMQRWGQLQVGTGSESARSSITTSIPACAPSDVEERRMRESLMEPVPHTAQNRSGESFQNNASFDLDAHQPFGTSFGKPTASEPGNGITTEERVDPEIEAFFNNSLLGDSMWDFLDVTTENHIGMGGL
ncbi:uncharacterized protein K452DRAFT_278809 [Aplosporella prunicola CBS 121167]|uniref:Zn(2)-C6 fungal-type domain-containing protein n=1 Tax=Aplosporella prunicola CBS 121167 TaxID=1176127 RepID=A0A6A6AZ27_9PEZI|nr:uncharacterized protein K452DRAFT_278809 [Aplosporella prunicola CBS 121167]KAF2137192.1 hypothetical protein K452DRAFT_278809 [Aplosporella prunicola CBS 121167]